VPYSQNAPIAGSIQNRMILDEVELFIIFINYDNHENKDESPFLSVRF
jgi:hypothetical protein